MLGGVGCSGIRAGPNLGNRIKATKQRFVLDINLLITAWRSCFWFGRASLLELERRKEEGATTESDVGWERVGRVRDDRQRRKLDRDDRQKRRKSADGRQVGLGGDLRGRVLQQLPRKPLSGSLGKQNSSRDSQPQRTSSAKETLSLEGIFFFFFLYDHNTNYTLKPIWVISPRKKADPIPPSSKSATSITMHLECFLKSSRSFDHFHCYVSASASIQRLAAVGGSDSSWEVAPRESVAGGGGGGDNDHLETTYLSNCLLYNKNYSVALSLNSQREGAAGGSWRLCFNQMSKQEPGALLRGGPSSLPQASFACEATGLPPGTR